MTSRRIVRPLLRLLLCVAVCLPVSAWSPRTRIEMLDQTIRLMPASLKLALDSHLTDVRRGMLEAQLEEDTPAHRPANGDRPGLEITLEQSAQELVQAIRSAKPFPKIAYRFGRLAHFVMDAGFPPGVSLDGDRRYGHFSALAENRRDRFPLIFIGHEDEALDQATPDFVAFADRLIAEAHREDRVLRLRYDAAGAPPDPSAFDDRSVPFAVASLSYSRSVTNTVRAWLACWRVAGGDIGRTPYLHAKPANVP